MDRRQHNRPTSKRSDRSKRHRSSKSRKQSKVHSASTREQSDDNVSNGDNTNADASINQRLSRNKAKSDSAAVAYIASEQFQGPKDGYVFQNGRSGIGYYLDLQSKYQKSSREIN
jgi:hypothetical protein